MGALMVEPTRSGTDHDLRTARLAELVFHLTGCSVQQAIGAVTEPPGTEPLERVARAIVRVRH